MNTLRRLLCRFGIDRPIGYSVLGTVRGLVGGPLVAFAIATQFTPELQGYFYTFAGILALQVFAEMGLGAVIVQFAAHEFALLERVNGLMRTDDPHFSRLASIARFALRWYGAGAIVVAAGLLAGGSLFLNSQPSHGVSWQLPWIVLVVAASTRFALSPFFSLLEGCGRLQSVYGYRLWEGTQQVIVTCAAVFLGAGLWTPAIVTVSAIASSTIFLAARHGRFLPQLFARTTSEIVSWTHELLPLQWRIALSWIAGYFVFQLFVPVIYVQYGPVPAGQLGLTLSLVATVNSLAGAWIATRIPQFGALVAQRNWAQLDSLAKRAAIGACSVAALGCVGALTALGLLQRFWPEMAARFVAPSAAAPFLVANVLVQLTVVEGAYLRSFKREPMLWISLVGGALIALSTWMLGSRFGVSGIGFGYLGVVTFVSLPVCTWIFVRLRAKWRPEVHAIGETKVALS